MASSPALDARDNSNGRVSQEYSTGQLVRRRRGQNTGLHYSFCGGRVVVGPDWPRMVLAIVLVAAPTGIYLGFIASDEGRDISWAIVAVIAASFVVTIACLLTTSFMDPGFIPRQHVGDVNAPPDDAMHDAKMKFEIHGQPVYTKYCKICKLMRPPRVAHCKKCSNCCRRQDHHCPYIGQCIGERNHRFYLAFLFTVTVHCCLVFAFSVERLGYIANVEHISWAAAIRHEPAAICLMSYTFVAFWFIAGLLLFHGVLISINSTSRDFFQRNHPWRSLPDTPWSLGCPVNWYQVMFAGRPARLVEFQPLPTDLQTGGQLLQDGRPSDVDHAHDVEACKHGAPTPPANAPAHDNVHASDVEAGKHVAPTLPAISAVQDQPMISNGKHAMRNVPAHAWHDRGAGKIERLPAAAAAADDRNSCHAPCLGSAGIGGAQQDNRAGSFGQIPAADLHAESSCDTQQLSPPGWNDVERDIELGHDQGSGSHATYAASVAAGVGANCGSQLLSPAHHAQDGAAGWNRAEPDMKMGCGRSTKRSVTHTAGEAAGVRAASGSQLLSPAHHAQDGAAGWNGAGHDFEMGHGQGSSSLMACTAGMADGVRAGPSGLLFAPADHAQDGAAGRKGAEHDVEMGHGQGNGSHAAQAASKEVEVRAGSDGQVLSPADHGQDVAAWPGSPRGSNSNHHPRSRASHFGLPDSNPSPGKRPPLPDNGQASVIKIDEGAAGGLCFPGLHSGEGGCGDVESACAKEPFSPREKFSLAPGPGYLRPS